MFIRRTSRVSRLAFRLSRFTSYVSRLTFCGESIQIMARRAARSHAGQALENLLWGLSLDNRIREGIHVLMNRHAHVLEREGQLRHEHWVCVRSYAHSNRDGRLFHLRSICLLILASQARDHAMDRLQQDAERVRQRHSPWRVKRERCTPSGKGGTGEMGRSIVLGMSQRVTFGVRCSGNLELRTSNPPPSRSSRPSRSPILREYSPVLPHVRTIEVPACQYSFPAAC